MKQGCGSRQYRGEVCEEHYAEYVAARNTSDPQPVVVACPNDFIPLVAELAENDAHPIFTLLWRAIGNWHLLGGLEESA